VIRSLQTMDDQLQLVLNQYDIIPSIVHVAVPDVLVL
jgi:hypothetical protein